MTTQTSDLPANIVLAMAYERAIKWIVDNVHGDPEPDMVALLATAFSISMKDVMRDIDNAFAGGS